MLLDFYVTPCADLPNDPTYFDIHITSFITKWTLAKTPWKEIVDLKKIAVTHLHIKDKYVIDLPVNPPVGEDIHLTCQRAQDFLSVLCSNPQHLLKRDLQSWIGLTFTHDANDGRYHDVDDTLAAYINGKVEIINQMKRNFPSRVETAGDDYIVHCCGPCQAERPKNKKEWKDDQKKFVRRKVKVYNDGRVVLHKRVKTIKVRGKKKRHLFKEVFCCGFRVEDIISMNLLEYGTPENVVAMYIGRRMWSLSFDSRVKAVNFYRIVEAQSAVFKQLQINVIIEEAPLHLVGVVRRQLDEIRDNFKKIHIGRKKNEAENKDIGQWQEIMETEVKDLDAKEKEIVEEFQSQIREEDQARKIQNGFNEAILQERQAAYKSIVDPDVFKNANFKEITRITNDEEEDLEDIGFGEKPVHLIINNYHFHHHLTIHKHIYHHYKRDKNKKNDEDVARETHSYTKTYTQNIIDIEKGGYLAKYNKNAEDEPNFSDSEEDVENEDASNEEKFDLSSEARV